MQSSNTASSFSLCSDMLLPLCREHGASRASRPPPGTVCISQCQVKQGSQRQAPNPPCSSCSPAVPYLRMFMGATLSHVLVLGL